MEFNKEPFSIKRGVNKKGLTNWCSFYFCNSHSTSGKGIDTYDLSNSLGNDYIHTITVTIRKKLVTDSKNYSIYKVVLITQLGDIFVFDSLDGLKEHLTEFFEKYPTCIEFDYDYKIK